MKKVLVTGGRGFVGRYVMPLLEGYDVTELPPINRLERRSSIQWFIRNNEFDSCLHLAWYTGEGYLSSQYNYDLAFGSVRLAEMLAESGCKYFLSVGTCAETLQPSTRYAASKTMLYTALKAIGATTGMSVGWARLHYLYGQGQNESKLIPLIYKAIKTRTVLELKDSTATHDYMHVGDVAFELYQLFKRQETGLHEIKSGVNLSVSQVVERITSDIGGAEYIRVNA